MLVTGYPLLHGVNPYLLQGKYLQCRIQSVPCHFEAKFWLSSQGAKCASAKYHSTIMIYQSMTFGWVWNKLNVFINSLTCWVKEWVQKWSLPKHHPQKRHQISHNLVCIISVSLMFLSIIQLTEKSSLRYFLFYFF